jgi:hypothetical protein
MLAKFILSRNVVTQKEQGDRIEKFVPFIQEFQPYKDIMGSKTKKEDFLKFLLYIGNRFGKDSSVMAKVLLKMEEYKAKNGILIDLMKIATEFSKAIGIAYKGIWGWSSFLNIGEIAIELMDVAKLCAVNYDGIEFISRGFMIRFMRTEDFQKIMEGMIRHYDAMMNRTIALPGIELGEKNERPPIKWGDLDKRNLKFIKYVDPIIIYFCQGANQYADELRQWVNTIYRAQNLLFGCGYDNVVFETANPSDHSKKVLLATNVLKSQKTMLMERVSKQKKLGLKQILSQVDEKARGESLEELFKELKVSYVHPNFKQMQEVLKKQNEQIQNNNNK